MKKNLLFANTCGKIYAEKVIFASEHKEKSHTITEIKNIYTGTGITAKSFVTVLMPSSFLILLYPLNESDIMLKYIIYGLTLFFSGLALLNMERVFYITIVMKKGGRIKIKTAIKNKKDAEKFINVLKKQIKNPETIMLRDLAS